MKIIILFIIYSLFYFLKNIYIQIHYKLIIHIYHLVKNIIIINLLLILDILDRLLEILIEIIKFIHKMILIINYNLLNGTISFDHISKFKGFIMYYITSLKVILLKLMIYLESNKTKW